MSAETYASMLVPMAQEFLPAGASSQYVEAELPATLWLPLYSGVLTPARLNKRLVRYAANLYRADMLGWPLAAALAQDLVGNLRPRGSYLRGTDTETAIRAAMTKLATLGSQRQDMAEHNRGLVNSLLQVQLAAYLLTYFSGGNTAHETGYAQRLFGYGDRPMYRPEADFQVLRTVEVYTKLTQWWQAEGARFSNAFSNQKQFERAVRDAASQRRHRLHDEMLLYRFGVQWS